MGKMEQAIRILEKQKEHTERVVENFRSYSSNEITEAKQTIEMCDMAIGALKEIQQYREIGTVEQCKELASIVNMAEKNELAKVIDEWLEYIKIGTVGECREAMEKQKPNVPDYEGDGCDEVSVKSGDFL